jgi:hypothetical protein
MGIRFNCPHCNRALNVKSAQAGLDGVCPACRQVVRIPDPAFVGLDVVASFQEESARDESDDNQDTAEGLDPVARQESEQLDIEIAPAEVVPNRNKGRFKLPEPEEARENFSLDKPTQNLGAEDPILEAPHLIWYYRNKEQGERGPLKSKAMQHELSHGGISPDGFVWREDWETWLPAAKVFPDLFVNSVAKASIAGNKVSLLSKIMLWLNRNPRYLRMLIVVICILLLAMIVAAIWLVIR